MRNLSNIINMQNLSGTLFRCILGLLLGTVTTQLSAEQTVEVEVLDRAGKPVPNVLVMLDSHESPIPDEPFVMDQVGMQFEPYVLVVPKGASVTFPNSDPVAHHVYSFTKPNNFVLPLYKGDAPQPVHFNHEGVVVLGCNIHDHMVGYIVVTDKKVSAWTDKNGKVSIGPVDADIPQNIRIWSPRIKASKEKTIALVTDEPSIQFSLKKRLRTAKRPQPPVSIYE